MFKRKATADSASYHPYCMRSWVRG
jgi:hypothetical protein